MKHFRTLTLAAAVILTGASAAAQAGEIEINAPDINSKLSAMVEKKMEELARKPDGKQEQSRVVGHSSKNLEAAPTVTQEVTDYERTVFRFTVL